MRIGGLGPSASARGPHVAEAAVELQTSVLVTRESVVDTQPEPWTPGGWSGQHRAKPPALLDTRRPAALDAASGNTRAVAARTRTRVMLADERPISRLALGTWLGADPALELVGKAGEIEDVQDLASRLNPDVIVLVCDRPGHPYTAMGRRLRRLCPRARVIVFSNQHDERTCAAAVAAEAEAHVCETDRADELLLTVRGKGIGVMAHPIGRSRCCDVHATGAPTLSSREREVLVHLARGMSAKQVAGELGICPKTVDNHTQRLMKKVGLHSRADVVLFAVRNGYVEV